MFIKGFLINFATMQAIQNKTLAETVSRLTSEDSLQNVCRRQQTDSPVPSQADVETIIDLCRAIIFPGYFGDSALNCDNLPYAIGFNAERLLYLLRKQITAGMAMATGRGASEMTADAARMALEFVSRLPELRAYMSEDVRSTYLGDPAATSEGEIILSYPTVRAITNYRIANALCRLGVPVIPRMIAERAHRETGIDIHPGATIGHAFMIDHGTGVVIGETAILGDRVKIYQGVTLGARSFPTDQDNNPIKGLPRHPIIGNDVVIYANSTILGRVTIGDGSIIGGNIWVTEDIAPGSIVVQARANNSISIKTQQQT